MQQIARFITILEVFLGSITIVWAQVPLPVLLPMDRFVSPVLTSTDGRTTFMFSDRFAQSMGGSKTATGLWKAGNLVLRCVQAAQSVTGSFCTTFVVLTVATDYYGTLNESEVLDIGSRADGKVLWDRDRGSAYVVLRSSVSDITALAHLITHVAVGREVTTIHPLSAPMLSGIGDVVASVALGKSRSRVQRVHEHPQSDRLLRSPGLAIVDGEWTELLMYQQGLVVGCAWQNFYNRDSKNIQRFLTSYRARPRGWKECIALMDEVSRVALSREYGCFADPQAGVWIIPEAKPNDRMNDFVVVVRDQSGGIPPADITVDNFCITRTYRVKANIYTEVQEEFLRASCPAMPGLKVRAEFASEEFTDVIILGDEDE